MTPKKFTLVLKEMGFTDVEQRESHYNPFEVRFIAVKK
jgi:predicted RNA binding protein YcfA (HicA-like mRNA interferase family)